MAQPGAHRLLVAGRRAARAVVPAVHPADRDRGALSGQRPRGGVGLGDPEQRVGHALDEIGRGGEAGEQRSRAVRVEQGQQLGAGLSRLGRAEEEPAHGRVEPAAHRRGGRPTRSGPRGTGVGRLEERGGPELLERAGGGDGFEVGRGRRRGGGRDVLGEERLGEVVPGDRRDDGVHPLVRGAEHEGQRAAVGAARDAHPGVASAVEPDVRSRGEEVDERPGVRDLVVRVVEMDPPAGRAEPARRVGEDDVPTVGQVAGPVDEVGLAPAEPVGEEHDGMRARPNRARRRWRPG